MTRRTPWILSALTAAALQGCGGPVPEASIVLPEAGPFAAGQLVTLDGSGSADLNDPPLDLAYDWSIVAAPAGSDIEIGLDGVPVIGVTPDIYGDYTFGLVVDNGEDTSARATATFTVGQCGNEAPVVDSVTAAPTLPGTGDAVHLSGAYHDADVDGCALTQAVSLTWRLASVPAGSTATLSSTTAEDPWFNADVPGAYVVELIATDSTGRASAAFSQEITVTGCGNGVPRVDGVDATPLIPNTGDRVQLAITASDSDNGDACGRAQALDLHSWLISAPAGSKSNLDSPASDRPSFVADVPGDYVVRTNVTDPTGRASSVDTTFNVSSCGSNAPELGDVAVAPAIPGVGDLVSLTVEATDADVSCGFDGPISLWSELVELPSGSATSMTPAAGSAPAFTPDVSGDYTVRTWATDETGRMSATDTVVTVDDCGGNTPMIDDVAVSPDAPDLSGPTTLAVTWHDDDTASCGRADSGTVWSEIIEAPAGSSATMAPSMGTTPSFTADVAGEYTIRTYVEDTAGHWSSADTTVLVGSCGGNLPVARIEVLEPVSGGPDTTVLVTEAIVDAPVALDASSSSDDDVGVCGLTEAFEYEWSFWSKPPASTAELKDPNLENPSFTPDVAGTYVLKLTVYDSDGSSEAWVSVQADATSSVWTATGYTLTFVDGDSTLWDAPRGLVVDGSGNIYVAQNGLGAITKTDSTGYTSLFSYGGYLGDIQDVEYYSTSNQWFVSSRRYDAIIRLDSTGAQTLYASGTVSNPSGLSLSGTKLAVADEGNDRLRFYTVTSAAGTGSTGTEDFGGGMNNPWGALIYGTTNYATTTGFDNEAWKTNTTTDVRLTTSLSEPRDIVRGGSGNFFVADPGYGMVAQVTDCATSGCTVTPIAWGLWEPFGLYFANSTTLLVTDNGGNALYKLTGTF